jgi:hypothetical protein
MADDPLSNGVGDYLVTFDRAVLYEDANTKTSILQALRPARVVYSLSVWYVRFAS